MRLLVLGGTRFLGRNLVDLAHAEGAEVTTFTRGVSGEPPAGVRALHGDRAKPEDLAVLADGEWDLVVDTSGYVPREVGECARLLADRARHYVFVSTVNVFPDWGTTALDDGSPTHDCPPDAGPDDSPTEDPADSYGYLKLGCERAVEEHFAGRCTHARAGLIVGPHDNVGRLPWWVWRIGKVAGQVLAPGDPDRPLQMIDARDLGEWFLQCGRESVTGAYIATGPKDQTTMAEVLDLCRESAGSTATFRWVPDDVLERYEVQPWVEMPLWMPHRLRPETWNVDASGAHRNGLPSRPLRDTIYDTWRWLRDLDGVPGRPDRPELPSPGMTPEREHQILTNTQTSDAAG